MDVFARRDVPREHVVESGDKTEYESIDSLVPCVLSHQFEHIESVSQNCCDLVYSSKTWIPNGTSTDAVGFGHG